MNGTLAQLITLVSFGNEFLNTNAIVDDFYSKNSTFQSCNSIEFVDFKKVFLNSKVKEIVIGQNPVEWFEFLKKGGCKKLALYFQHSKNHSFAPDHKNAGAIGGGGSWL